MILPLLLSFALLLVVGAPMAAAMASAAVMSQPRTAPGMARIFLVSSAASSASTLGVASPVVVTNQSWSSESAAQPARSSAARSASSVLPDRRP